ncbi:MAG TPA: hypothetical protein VNI20_00830 [Fimbriimonadaceae bacterium]|nr:hypothetical protein [Fimbriimonadaceae bacterium]
MTVQDCIDGLHVTYPQVADALALTYFQQIHREIVALAQIETDSEDVPLVAGQREYALNATDKVVSVRAAYTMKSATDVARLAPTSTDWLDENRPTWREDQQTGDPVRFYIEGVDAGGGEVHLGLDPIPAQSAVAGYPKVVIFGTTYQALVAADPIPGIVPSIRVYVEGMKRLYASDRDPSRVDQWDALYRTELQRTLASINGSTEDLDAPRIVPAWMRNRRVE